MSSVPVSEILVRQEELGRVEVSKHAIMTLVGHVTNECYGIVGMAARGLRDGIAERLNMDNIHRGVVVTLTNEGVAIDLYVIVEYGVRVSEVAQNLMSVVGYAVERTMGLTVCAVNVNVQGIHGGDRDHGEIF
ncbi:MAG: Asp23/Gls24 family envelope stress response protein [Candidatus Dormibacteria bacterium]